MNATEEESELDVVFMKAQRLILSPKATREEMLQAREEVAAFGDAEHTGCIDQMLGERLAAEAGEGLGAKPVAGEETEAEVEPEKPKRSVLADFMRARSGKRV